MSNDYCTPPAGDPFSAAYARNGRHEGKRYPDKYQGYGIDTPRQPCPDQAPTDILLECLRSAQTLLQDTLQTAELAPWIHPPFRGLGECDSAQAVLSVTAAVNAVTNATGIALGAALGLPVLEMASATDYQTLFTLVPPQSRGIRVKSWGLSTSTAPSGITVNVQGSTASGVGLPKPPDPNLSTADVAGHQETFFILQPDQPLSVRALLTDLTTPAVINFGICYWTYPVNKRIDGKAGQQYKPGYGLDCS